VRIGHPAYGQITTCPTSSALTGVNTTRSITCTAAAGALFAVTGTINGDGSPLSGAWVSLNGTPTGQTNTIFLGGQTASNGTFSISVPPGVYKVRADKPGYKSPAESTATVTSATVSTGTISLVTASRTITGTITVDSSGVSNAFVDATDGAGGYAVAQTNASGAYTLNVSDGTWTIRAHSMGYEGGPLPVTVSGSNVSGQTVALTAISGFTIKAERPETFTPSAGGFLTNTDIGSNFQMEIPANALGTGSNAATVTTKINTAMPNPPSGSILSKNAVSIDAVDSAGSPISSLNDEIVITIPYTEADLPAGTAEASLVIGVWSDANQTYETLSTTVDTTLNTLTATVSHLSDFAPLIASGGSAPSTPSGLSISNAGNGTTVNLTWTATSGASTYNVYRSTDNSSFPLLASPSTNSYSATGLTAGTTYYFKISAVNSTDDESAATSASSIAPSVTTSGGGGGGGGSTADITLPANALISINTGAATTASLNATLSLGATDNVLVTQMMISNVAAFTGVSWESYAVSKSWTLSSGDGVKTVYAKFRDSAGNTSVTVSDTITVSGSGTVASVTPATPASKEVPGCGNRTTGFSTSNGGSCATNVPATPASPSNVTVTYKLGNVTLKNGSKGNDVKELQRVLNKILKLSLAVDGKLGPKTIAEIKKWQKAHGLVADGLVGAKTKAKMKAEA
ncbi:MAG: carboxypeptidase regulatory-like domain-containing protein, partial [Minisyncoccia bacterium]